MKERTVVLTFEIVTNRPARVLRESQVWLTPPYLSSECQYLAPVNKPRVEVIQTGKRGGKGSEATR